MTARPTVDIIMAVHNGARFLPDQLRSIREQSHRAWRLWVRDDGSTDGSSDLVEATAEEDPRVRLLRGDGRRLGAALSFGWLLERLPDDARWVMFSDQDDWWLPDKIERTFDALPPDARDTPAPPVLVHTDARVVDAGLNEVAPSFWEYQRLVPRPPTLKRLLGRNMVTGHTVLASRALVDRALPLSPEIVMHDWWLALVAAAFGRIVDLPEATVLYRQHGGNVAGARRIAGMTAAEVGRKLLGSVHAIPRLRADLAATARQAEAFADRYGPELSPEDARLVRSYAEIPRCGFLERKARVLRLRVAPEEGLLRNVGMVLRA